MSSLKGGWSQRLAGILAGPAAAKGRIEQHADGSVQHAIGHKRRNIRGIVTVGDDGRHRRTPARVRRFNQGSRANGIGARLYQLRR